MWDVHVGLVFLDPECFDGFSDLRQTLAQRAIGAVLGGRPYLGFGKHSRPEPFGTASADNRICICLQDDDVWLQSAVNQGASVHQ